MTHKEYYKVSEEKKLPLRCPCLSKCLRYRITAYYIGSTCFKPKRGCVEDNMREMGIVLPNENVSKLIVAGEPTTFIGGNSSFYLSNGCPEFFLHEHEHKLVGMDRIATHQFSYDEYYPGSKFRPGESRHYTECPEYSLFVSKKIDVNPRRKVSPKIKAELQKEIMSECPFCASDDVGIFEVHHIDENRSNNRQENLLMLCANCHTKITKGDISREEAFTIKVQLKERNT